MSTIAKVRNLGQYGIISDIDPYDLPLEAFSSGVNVRFRNGRISRAPIFRDVATLTGDTTGPRYTFSANPNSGEDLIFVGYLDGSIYLVSSSSQANYSISSYTPSSADDTWTSCHLANITYANRGDRAPWYYDGSIAGFKTLTNWPSNTTCELLRACGGTLVALNITASGVNNPTQLYTSEQASAGSVPASWDFTNPATDATENILAEMEGPIVDAQNFGSSLVIYGYKEAWLMTPSTGEEVFDYAALPFAKGAINSNCSVQIDGNHYIFGPDDIWMHDGVSEQSIVFGKNRDYIFSSINMGMTNRCFVLHNPALKEIYFCYVSGDNLTHFSSANVNGCNRCFTYNYVAGTGTFDDLPSVFSGTYANVNTGVTWANTASSWATIGGSWQSQAAVFQRTTCFVGETVSAYSLTQQLYAFDLFGVGSTASFPVDTNATAGAFLERDGIDLDMIQDINLPDYKLFSSLYPLARIDANANTDISISFGTSDYYGQAAVFDGPTQTYDGDTLYKLDFNMSGRYAAMTITYNDYTTFSISGFDFLVDETGQR